MLRVDTPVEASGPPDRSPLGKATIVTIWRIASVGVVVALVVTATAVAPVGAGTLRGPGSPGAALGDEIDERDDDADVGFSDPARSSESHDSERSDDFGFHRGGHSSVKYCKALRSALSSSQHALSLQGRQLRLARLETSHNYRQAAKKSPSRSVERAMNAAFTVYAALTTGHQTRAASASVKRFAAVPAAAPKVRKDCGVDLFWPVDYQFRVIQKS